MVLIRKYYDDLEEFPGEVFTEPTMTQQHFKQECNINEILNRYKVTGVLPVNSQNAWFADLSESPKNYQEALHIAQEAQEHFTALPSSVRAHFDNNCAAYLDFVTNPTDANIQTGIELGLWSLPEVKEEPKKTTKSKATKQPEPEPAD